MDIVKPRDCYKKLLVDKLMNEMISRNFELYFCVAKDDAVKKVLELIPVNCTVSCGGSATLQELG